MELIITLIVLIIIWCVAFMVGNKQGTNRIINQIKKDGGYYDMEITGAAYPYKHMPSWTPPTSSINNDTMGTIGSKPKTQTDYQNEHKVEQEKGDIDFMHKWIQEKSGKKDPIPKKENSKQFNGIKTEEPFVKTRKRKPKTTKEWEDEFDIGGNS
jgi:hypothetical protein